MTKSQEFSCLSMSLRPAPVVRWSAAKLVKLAFNAWDTHGRRELPPQGVL